MSAELLCKSTVPPAVVPACLLSHPTTVNMLRDTKEQEELLVSNNFYRISK